MTPCGSIFSFLSSSDLFQYPAHSSYRHHLHLYRAMTSLRQPSGWLCSWRKCLGSCEVAVGTSGRWFSVPRISPRPQTRWRDWPKKWPSSAPTGASELTCCRCGGMPQQQSIKKNPPWNLVIPYPKGLWTNPHHQHSAEDPFYCQSHHAGTDKHQWGGVRTGMIGLKTETFIVNRV